MARSTFVLLLALAANAMGNPLDLGKRATCNADNCARQVTGTSSLPSQPPRSQRASDCASFLMTVVTPAPIVSTVTSTIVAGQATPTQSAIVTTAQTGSASSVPSYISMCGAGAVQTSRYSSACACFPGVTGSVTTTTTPTVTTTVYTACSTIVLQATDGPVAGNYFTTPYGDAQYLSNDPTYPPTQFVYKNGMLYAPGSNTVLVNTLFNGPSSVQLDDAYAPNNPNFTPLICSIAASAAITCQAKNGADDTFQYRADNVGDGPVPIFFAKGVQRFYTGFVPKALPVCAA